MTTSVDFDYNGPPVTVSNAMAVQLVAEFGIRNAWFAFLKLRGMKLKNEEAANAHESFTYFRNKIGHLRRLAKEHKVDSEKQKDKNNEDFDLLFSADFDNFFVSSDSLELRKDAQQYSDIEDNELLEDNVTSSTSSIGETNSSLTTVSLLQVIEQNKKRQQKVDDIIENVQNKKKISESEQFEEQKDDISVQGKNSQGKKISRTNKKTAENQETKQMVEKLLAAKEEIARRHAETIDDVVSVVMEKIRNNQPFEGELSAQSGHFIPPKSHHKRAGIGGSGQKLVHHRSAIMGQIKSDEIRQQQQGSTVLSSVPTEGILTSTPTTAFSHFSPGQSIVLLQNPLPSGGLIQIPQSQISFGGHSSTSLNSPPHKSRHNAYNGQLMGETPIHSQQQQFPIGSPVYSPLQGTASRLQQQHQNIYTLSQPIITGDSSIGGGTTTTAIPLEMAIQQNMTVQELIQTLKVQGNRSTNTQIILQTNGNLPSTPTPLTSSILSTNDLPIQNQQETPDSSSQEANIQETALSYLKKDKSENQIKKVRRKKKGENEQQTEKLNIEKTEAEFNLQEKQKITFPMSDNIIGQSQLIEKIKDKKPTTTNVNIPSDSSVNQKQNQRIDELESQLKKLNKQLLTERNKSATQKKRAEKALSDLEKASDSIQLLRIDLACQKTDNNTLISENIALKAENQQLRSKEKRSSGPSLLTGISKNRKRKEITAEPEMLTEKSGGRSRKSSLKTGLSSEKPQTPPPLSSELGRRQSKRICVTRNQFMRNFF